MNNNYNTSEEHNRKQQFIKEREEYNKESNTDMGTTDIKKVLNVEVLDL